MSQDQKLVASQQEYELEYIQQKFDVPKEELERVMLELGSQGKYCRSRRIIYSALKSLGYTPKKKTDALNL